jgi:hypothetical protein
MKNLQNDFYNEGKQTVKRYNKVISSVYGVKMYIGKDTIFTDYISYTFGKKTPPKGWTDSLNVNIIDITQFSSFEDGLCQTLSKRRYVLPDGTELEFPKFSSLDELKMKLQLMGIYQSK